MRALGTRAAQNADLVRGRCLRDPGDGPPMGTNGHKSIFLPLHRVAPAHPPTEEALHLQGFFEWS